jgi:putative tricarboxylic transport membrane protein
MVIDVLGNLALGFGEALTPANLLYCLVGSLVGTLVGVLPGLGPLAAIAMLLPLTFSLPPIGAFIMLSGIYYGAQYGGSIAAILVNIPGESSTVVTCLDGHPMALQGRGGAALSISAIGSFVAGSIVTLLIATMATSISSIALGFGPPEYFSLLLLGLIGSVLLASGSVLNAIAMICLGLLLSMVGMDPVSGAGRMTFGIPEFSAGVGLIPLTMGLFGVSEVLYNLSRKRNPDLLSYGGFRNIWPTRQKLRSSFAPILRGTGLGALLGILPGGGATLSSFVAYGVEKKLSKEPERFGNGAIEGVASPEAANNAGAQASFIPMLTLGIPANAVMALMIGALSMHGIQTGPQIINEQPKLFWALVASMWIGNLMLLFINLPLVGIWVRLLKFPYHFLFPMILTFSCIGVYGAEMSTFDVFVMLAFGVLGFIIKKLDGEPAPLVLAFIVGPMIEASFRRSMIFSRGDMTIFIERPISAGLLIATAALVIMLVMPKIRSYRREVFVADENE